MRAAPEQPVTASATRAPQGTPNGTEVDALRLIRRLLSTAFAREHFRQRDRRLKIGRRATEPHPSVDQVRRVRRFGAERDRAVYGHFDARRVERDAWGFENGAVFENETT